MRLALALVLLCAATAWATPRIGGPRFVKGKAAHVDPTGPFFEFAPISAEGMTAACACTTPTGRKGEVMTFTRASSGTCLKTVGAAPQTIANGDLVTCASGQPRVMPGTDGTSVNGLLVEASRTNVVLRSQELDNAAWTLVASGVAVPTVTANQATAPDGTFTAERVQIPSTGGANYSLLQSGSVLAGTTVSSVSIFVLGNGTLGQVCLAAGNGTGANCLCTYTNTAWTRCACDNNTIGAGAVPLFFGNYSGAAGGGCTGYPFSPQDIFVWGAQGETNGAPYSTSYIATTSAAVTRSADDATMAVLDLTSPTVSMAATVVPDWSGTTGPLSAMATGMKSAGSVTSFINFDGVGTSARFYDGVSCCAQTAVLAGAQRYNGFRSLTALTVNYGTNTNTLANSTPPNDVMTGVACIGSDCAGTPMDGVVKQVCIDSSSTRCR